VSRRRWQLLRLLYFDDLPSWVILSLRFRAFELCRGELLGGWVFHVHVLPSRDLLGGWFFRVHVLPSGNLFGGCRSYEFLHVYDLPSGDLLGGWFFHVHVLSSGNVRGCRGCHMLSV
jgi:hypothetical protein